MELVLGGVPIPDAENITIARTFKFRLYPTSEQEARLRSWCAATRAIYNAALEQRKLYFRAVGTDPLGRDHRTINQGKELTTLLRDPVFEWMRDAPIEGIRLVLRDLDKAFKNFFDGRAAYPSWRRAGVNESITLRVFVEGKQWRRGYHRNVTFGRDSVRFPKIGRIRYRKHKKLTGDLRTATITRDGGRWYVCVSSKIEIKKTEPVNDLAVGIDFGVTIPFATSTHEVLAFNATPERLRKREKRLRRELARSRKGSMRRIRRRRRLSEFTRKIADRRTNQLHQITTDLTRRFGLIAIEDLKIKNMTSSAKGTAEDPGKNVKAKAGLNREMLDRSPGMFRLLLDYKAVAAGCTVIAVDPRYTSQTCSKCGAVDSASRRDQATFVCTSCGHEANADFNAASNILARALSTVADAGHRKASSEFHTWKPAAPNPVDSPFAGRDLSRFSRNSQSDPGGISMPYARVGEADLEMADDRTLGSRTDTTQPGEADLEMADDRTE